MADLEGSSSIDIEAPIERCFEIIADVERAPEWQGAMQKAKALEYDARGRPLLVETHINAIVANVRVWLRFDYFEPNGMRWTRERGTSRCCPVLGSSRIVAAGKPVRRIRSRSD
jgi:hypothetical protein